MLDAEIWSLASSGLDSSEEIDLKKKKTKKQVNNYKFKLISISHVFLRQKQMHDYSLFWRQLGGQCA